MNQSNRKRALSLIAGAVLAATLLFLTHDSMARAVTGTGSRATFVGTTDFLRPVLQSSTTISVTKRDELLVDADGSGAAGPGDTLQYTIVVTNSGASEALDIAITDTLDARTTLSGTVSVSPIAADDRYEVLGNTFISMSAGTGVLANDLDPDGGALALQDVSMNTTEEGGEITLDEDGSFTYDPPAGFSGDDFFRYTIEDDDGLQAIGVIQFVVSDLIWYVDDTADVGGDGRLSAPFADLAAAQSAAGADDVIFLYDGNYTGNLSLATSQQLIGQGVELAAGAGLTPPPGTVLPSQTISPTLSGSVGLGQDNTVRGLSLAQNGSTALTGASFGTLTVSNVAIAGAGRGLNLENGDVAATFDAITSTNSSNEGIRLIDISGSLIVSGGEIDGADSAGFYMSGSAADVSYGGAIVADDADAYAVWALNNSGGTLTLEGAISSTNGVGRGIRLTGNSGASIHFGDAINLNTGSQTAFIASGGGSVTAIGAGSTLSTSGAAAITIENTTIGAEGVTFRRISAANSAKGIVLNNTGAGAFTVTGEGATAGSGGTLQNISARAIEVTNSTDVSINNVTLDAANTLDSGGAGACDALHTTGCNAAVYLSNVHDVSFDNVQITGTIEEQGINGIAVDGFRLLNSAISQCGNAQAEGCVKMRELTGEVQIANSELGDAAEKVVEIHNSGGSLDLTVTDSIFRDTQGKDNGADGLEIVTSGDAQANVNISDSSFLRLRTNGVQLNGQGDSSVDISVTGSTFDAEGASGKAIQLALIDDSRLTFDLFENPRIYSYGGNAITVAAFDRSAVEGRIHANGDIQLGGAGTSGSGVFVQVNDNAGGIVQISNNDIDNVGWDNGIRLLARPDLLEIPTGRLDATVENNSINSVDASSLYGIELQAQALNETCANVENNTVSGTSSATFRVRGIDGGAVLLEGFATDAATTWTTKGNTGAPVSESPAGTASAGVCARPNLALEDAETLVHQAPDYRQSFTPAATAGAVSTSEQMTSERSAMVSTDAKHLLATAAERMNVPAQQAADIEVGPFTLPAGKAVTVTYQVQIEAPFPAGIAPQLENQAWVSGDNFATIGSDDPDTAQPGDATIAVLDAAPDLALHKAGAGDEAAPGETLSYELTYANEGNQNAAGVVITETVPQHTTFNVNESNPGWSCTDNGEAGSACTMTPGTVAAGAAEETVIFAVTVLDIVAAGADQIENVAVIGDDGMGGSDAQPSDNESAETTHLDAQPDLQLSKVDGGVTVAPGETLVYTLTYTNAGNQGATGVVINELVPEHTTFDAEASTAGWSCAGGSAGGTVCAFGIGGLNGGATGDVVFAVTANSPAAAGVEQVDNSASIEDDGTNGADANAGDNSDATSTPLDAAPAFMLQKDDGSASPGSGEELSYTLTLENVGDQAATGVVLTETVPANTTFDAGNSDAGWSCEPDGNAGSTCTFSLDDSLESGSDVSIQFAVVVDGALPAGVLQVANQARADAAEAAPVSSDDPETSEGGDATETPLDVRADLSLTKDDGETVAVPGEPLTYTIVVQNLGPDSVAGATVSDELPTAFAGASWTCESGAGASCGAGAGTGDLNETVDVDAGATLTYTVSGVIHRAAVGTLSNSATVTAPAGVGDPVIANNTALDDDTALSPEVDLTLSMDESTDPVLAGSGAGNLTTVVTLTNRGPSLATDVTVDLTFNLPAGVALDDVDVNSPNASFGGSVWTVATLGMGASEVLTATLTAGSHADAGQDVISIDAAVTSASQTIVETGDDSVTELISIARGVDIQLAITESTDIVTAGLGVGNLTYVVSATNAGPSTASGVSLTNTLSLPTGVSVLNITPGGTSTWDEGDETWSIGDLPVGASETLTIQLNVGADTLPGTDTIKNQAMLLTTNEEDLQPENNEVVEHTSVATAADLVLSLNSEPQPAVAGMPLTYTVTITNNGPSHARNVVASSDLPDSITPLQSSGCTEDPDGGQTCGLGVVDAGATVVFTNVVVVDSAATGSVVSSVHAAADTAEANAGDESDSQSTDLERVAGLSVALSATPNPVGAGQPLTYTVVVSNAGPSRATGIDVTSTLSQRFDYERDSCEGAHNEGEWTWSLNELDANSQVICHIRGVIDDAFGGLITSTASLSSAISDPDADDDSVEHEVMVYDNNFSVGDLTQDEGNEGGGAFTFTITRTSNAVDSTVDVSTEAVTATAGEDFSALTNRTVHFSAGGSLTETVAITVTGDELVEMDETFHVKLSNPVNGAISQGQAAGTIVNDDSATITIGDVSKEEGDIGTTGFVFELSLSAAVDTGIGVSYATADGTAEDENGDGDYTAAMGRVHFDGDAGEGQTIVVTVNGDEVEEPDETLVVNLTNLDAKGRNVSLVRSQGQGAIINDDGGQARTYIYYFPIGVKQATMPSGGNEVTDPAPPAKESTPGVPDVIPITPKRHGVSIDQEYGGAFTH